MLFETNFSEFHSRITKSYYYSRNYKMATQITANGFEQRIPHIQEKDLPGNANWVVQKYGGTSLGKFAVQIAEDIVV